MEKRGGSLKSEPKRRTTAAAAAKLELELLTPLLEKHGLTVSKRTTLEGRAALFLRVGVVTSVKPGAQLGVTQDLVRLIDLRHLLLGVLLGKAVAVGLVRVVFPRHLAIRRFDLAFVGVAGYTENPVVILCFRALEVDAGFVQEGVDNVLLVLSCLGGALEGADGGFEFFRFLEGFGAVEEAVEGVFVKGERFGTILLHFLSVHLLWKKEKVLLAHDFAPMNGFLMIHLPGSSPRTSSRPISTPKLWVLIEE